MAEAEDQERTVEEIQEALDSYQVTEEQQDRGEELAEKKSTGSGSGSVVVKPQLCGKYCDGCPHGPYAWLVSDDGWTYLGQVGGKTSESSTPTEQETTEDVISDDLFTDFEDVQSKPDPSEFGSVEFSKSGYEFEVSVSPYGDLEVTHGDTTRRVQNIDGNEVHLKRSLPVAGGIDGIRVPDTDIINEAKDIQAGYQESLSSWKDDRENFYSERDLAVEAETIDYNPPGTGYGSEPREETVLKPNKPESVMDEEEKELVEALERRDTVGDDIEAPDELSPGDRGLAENVVEQYAEGEYDHVQEDKRERKRQEQVRNRYTVTDSSSRRQRYEGDDYWTFREYEINDEETGESYDVTVKVDHVGNTSITSGKNAPDDVKKRAKNLSQPSLS